MAQITNIPNIFTVGMFIVCCGCHDYPRILDLTADPAYEALPAKLQGCSSPAEDREHHHPQLRAD